MASQTTQLALGALAAAVVGVGVVVIVETQNTPAEIGEVSASVVEVATPAVEPVSAAPEPDPEPVIVVTKPAAPQFDTFRVEGDGLFVIAGKAAAGQTVDVMLAGQQVERVVADANGSFGAVLVLDPSDDARRLGLLADPEGDAIASAKTFLVEPFSVVPDVEPEPAGPIVVGAVTANTPVPEAAPLAANDIAASTDVQLPNAPVQQSEPVETALVIDEATVLVADEDGVRVVPAANDLPPEITANIALDTITYDPQGEVEIAGRASGDGFVQVYIDNKAITSSRIAEGGNWRTDLPEVDTGIYTLRIDEVDDAGEVVSRIETPFKREDTETVAAVLAEDVAEEGFDVAVRTVQPGTTLWAIAKEEMGAGIMYVAVYEANRDLIRDPDLIYPGQVFRMPEVTE